VAKFHPVVDFNYAVLCRCGYRVSYDISGSCFLGYPPFIDLVHIGVSVSAGSDIFFAVALGKARAKPKLFSTSLAELSKDHEQLALRIYERGID